jgi:YidC/Oxa1 family membrane protein insertase
VKEMSEQVRGVIFVVLVLAITFVWLHFNPPSVPPHKPVAPAAQTAPAQATTTAPAAPSAAVPAKPAVITAIQATEEKIIVVESTLYRVELSNRGGVVRSWKLKQYLNDETPPRPLDLVNADAAQQLGWPLSLLLSDAALQDQANTALYDVTPASGDLNAPAEITFHWSDGHLDITKKLKFAQNYEVSVETSAALDGKPLAPGIAWRGGFGDRAVYQAAQLVNVFYKQGDKLNLLAVKKLGVSGNQAQPLALAGPMEYAGIEDQFFTAAFLPDGTDLSLWHWTQNHSVTVDNKQASESESEMAAGTTTAGPLRTRLYVGPKEMALLGKVRPPLDELINLGWFGVIAKPLMFVLQWIHRYIPNYGWAIVAFTLALTMAMFPIRLWTFHSARKMQAVAPEIKEIQERYKKYSMRDPRKRKMNEEVMAVYQREGINPVGSCLPMLVQIPFLYAFYRMLMGTIELRHAPWFGWIHDLSKQDPYYILPIAMVITSYLMTKMTPTPATVDPAQQKMMALMPVMLGFVFIRLSSGLNLYYFTSNLIGMIQQWYLNRAQPPPSRSKFKKKKE